jgi:hypothetical protein
MNGVIFAKLSASFALSACVALSAPFALSASADQSASFALSANFDFLTAMSPSFNSLITLVFSVVSSLISFIAPTSVVFASVVKCFKFLKSKKTFRFRLVYYYCLKTS